MILRIWKELMLMKKTFCLQFNPSIIQSTSWLSAHLNPWKWRGYSDQETDLFVTVEREELVFANSIMAFAVDCNGRDSPSLENGENLFGPEEEVDIDMEIAPLVSKVCINQWWIF